MGTQETQEEMFSGPAVASLNDTDILASLSAYARAFGTDRETLRRCLLENGLVPVAERSGHKLYALRDVYRAWADATEETDPDKLTPFKRRAWYQGEREKLHLQTERGELVQALEMERTLGRIIQEFVKGLETSQDVIERDCGLTPAQASKLEAHLDQVREDLYKLLAGELPEEEGGGPPEASADPATPAPKPAPVSRETPSSGSAVDDAVTFLREALAGGGRATADLIVEAKKVGLSEATLRRAKAQLGDEIQAKRQGKGWAWQLAQGARQA